MSRTQQNTYPFPRLPRLLFQANAATPSMLARSAMTKELKRVRHYRAYLYRTCVRLYSAKCLFIPLQPLPIVPSRVPADDKCDANAVCRGVDKCSGKSCQAKSPCHSPGKCNFKTGLCSNPFAPKTLKCDDKNPKTGVTSLSRALSYPCRCQLT